MVESIPEPGDDGFSPEWLTLREPADHAARSSTLTQRLADWVREQGTLSVMELGCGTGSNLRYLCPQLGHRQQWTLYDYDAALLQHLPLKLQQWAVDEGIEAERTQDGMTLSSADFTACIRWQRADLANELESLPFASTRLLTGSALLDLTSENWLQRLARLCINHQCASLFVLNYNGQIRWQPALESDSLPARLLNEHQLNDKGFGKAMGPSAGQTLARLLSHTQDVTVERSDWQIDSIQKDLQTALLDGWLEASLDVDPAASTTLRQWHERRHRHIASLESRLTVGHSDILSIPASGHTTTV